MAVGEAITNLLAAPVSSLAQIKLSANWMAAAGHPGEDARLYAAVQAASTFAQQLGIALKQLGTTGMQPQVDDVAAEVGAEFFVFVFEFLPARGDHREAALHTMHRDGVAEGRIETLRTEQNSDHISTLRPWSLQRRTKTRTARRGSFIVRALSRSGR